MSSASTSRATGSASIFDARIRQSTQIMNQPILLTIFSLFFSDFFMYQPNLSSSPLIFFQTFMHRRFPRVTLSLQPEYLQRTPFPLSPCPQTRIPDNHAVLENRSKKPSKTTLRVPAPLESCPPFAPFQHRILALVPPYHSRSLPPYPAGPKAGVTTPRRPLTAEPCRNSGTVPAGGFAGGTPSRPAKAGRHLRPPASSRQKPAPFPPVS